MTEDQFQGEMLVLESALRPKLNPEANESRREAMRDAVLEFPFPVLKEGRRRYCRDTGDDEWQQFPTPGHLRRLCLEFVDEQRVEREKAKQTTKRFEPMPHKCSPVERNSALSRLALLPYEVAHAGCQGEILATCPLCGTRFKYVNPMIESLMRQFPDQTKGWSSFHKGMLLCLKHVKKSQQG